MSNPSSKETDQPTPPALPSRVLRWVCPPSLFETIEGDLVEQFELDLAERGATRARIRFVWNVMKFVRPGIILRNKISSPSSVFPMLQSYVAITLRNLLKRKLYSAINLVGLVLGMTAFLFISIYVWNERNYENFNVNKEHIYRVRQDRFSHGALSRQWTAGPWGIGPDLKSSFPEVVRHVSVNRGGMRSVVLSRGSLFFEEGRVLFASADFFTVFSYSLIKGVDSLVLRKPFTMVISESMAKRYFGAEDPIGKTLTCNGKEEYEITGIFRDVPENTHLKFDALFSFESLLRIVGPADAADLLSNWAWAGNYTYIQLAAAVDPRSFEAKLPAFVTKEAGDFLKQWDEGMAFVLQPLSSIHLHSNFKDELEPNGDARTVSILSVVALLVLAMAWINYINLSTARSSERSKEVVIRKVLGAVESQLVRQFLFESMVMKVAAVLLTTLAVVLLFPHFGSLIGTTIDPSAFASPPLWLFIAGMALAGSIIAGLYPAFVISGFQPISVLKGKSQHPVGGNYVRKGLVIIQFVSSILLIAAALVVSRQLEFMNSSSLGFLTEQVLVIQGPHVKDSASYTTRFEAFRQSLLQNPEIRNVAVSSDVPGRAVRGSNGGVRLVGQDPRMGNSFRVISVDEEFIETYGITPIAGRTFSRDRNDHWKTALVNETAMKLLGFTNPEKIIGEKIYLWDVTVEIVGVVKDYHQESLKKKIDQLIFVCDKEVQDYYSLRIRPDNPLAATVSKVEARYKTTFPGEPFHYFFLDDFFNQQYHSDRQFGKMVTLFTILGTTLACLGLFGLSSYLIMQRTREIGIRKVLGASLRQITLLISREFIYLVLLATLVAWPIAFFLLNNWLNTFANRISLGILSFLLPGIIALTIAILTVATQSIRAALTNPADTLRSE